MQAANDQVKGLNWNYLTAWIKAYNLEDNINNINIVPSSNFSARDKLLLTVCPTQKWHCKSKFQAFMSSRGIHVNRQMTLWWFNAETFLTVSFFPKFARHDSCLIKQLCISGFRNNTYNEQTKRLVSAMTLNCSYSLSAYSLSTGHTFLHNGNHEIQKHYRNSCKCQHNCTLNTYMSFLLLKNTVLF